MKACFQFAMISYRGISRGSYILCDSKGLCEQREHSYKEFIISYNITYEKQNESLLSILLERLPRR